MAKDWTTIKKAALASGQITEEGVEKRRQQLLAEQRAYRLAEVRKAHGLTQGDLARVMRVSQSRVSAFEKGELDASELGTVRKYVEALGGKVRVVAEFGDDQVTVG